jgi:hypothetical protein
LIYPLERHDSATLSSKLAYKSDIFLFNKINFEHDLEDFNFTFIQLPKFPKTKEDQLENIAEKWIYIFRCAKDTSEEDFKKIKGNVIIIGKAYSELNQFSWTKEERFLMNKLRNIPTTNFLLSLKSLLKLSNLVRKRVSKLVKKEAK